MCVFVCLGVCVCVSVYVCVCVCVKQQKKERVSDVGEGGVGLERVREQTRASNSSLSLMNALPVFPT